MTLKKSFEITELYQELWEKRFKKENKRVSQVICEFYPYTTLKNTIRRRGDKTYIRISDMLKDAPKDVIQALGVILFCKLEGKRAPKREVKLYRDFVNSKKIRALLKRTRRERGEKKFSGPKGEFYHLKRSFDRINNLYFQGDLDMPRLTWSQRKTKTRFGHHDKTMNTIVISRTLDDINLPIFLLDYIMFHEALHMKHGIHYEKGRRRIHTRAFKNDERRFKEYEKATALLKKLSGRKSVMD